jgi:hypothetical protein
MPAGAKMRSHRYPAHLALPAGSQRRGPILPYTAPHKLFGYACLEGDAAGRRVSATRREFRSLLRPCHREHSNFVKAMFIRRLSLPRPDAQPQFSTESTADPTGHCRSLRSTSLQAGISQLKAKDYRLFRLEIAQIWRLETKLMSMKSLLLASISSYYLNTLFR